MQDLMPSPKCRRCYIAQSMCVHMLGNSASYQSLTHITFLDASCRIGYCRHCTTYHTLASCQALRLYLWVKHVGRTYPRVKHVDQTYHCSNLLARHTTWSYILLGHIWSDALVRHTYLMTVMPSRLQHSGCGLVWGTCGSASPLLTVEHPSWHKRQ